jgi:Ca-activated chloride channel family protein
MAGFSVLKVFATILILVLFLPGMGAEQREREQSGDIPRYRVGVDIVSLPVVVTTAKGKRITDLHKDDFRIYENDVEQEIAAFAATDEPLAVALLLDTSGSTQKKLARIQNAAIDFVNQLHPDDEVAVISFADDVRLQSDFSINRDKNARGIKMTRTGECTALYEAVWLALEQVLDPVPERKALVLFTDGVDTCSIDSNKTETLKVS